jgi:hypothetical protein
MRMLVESLFYGFCIVATITFAPSYIIDEYSVDSTDLEDMKVVYAGLEAPFKDHHML